jgi:hypothetical protein
MEGWHSGFNQKLHWSHPTVWELIDAFKTRTFTSGVCTVVWTWVARHTIQSRSSLPESCFAARSKKKNHAEFDILIWRSVEASLNWCGAQFRRRWVEAAVYWLRWVERRSVEHCWINRAVVSPPTGIQDCLIPRHYPFFFLSLERLHVPSSQNRNLMPVL